MGRYLREARYHFDKIEHYYKHGAEGGFAQAKYHWDKLSELLIGAQSSNLKKNNADASIIQGIRESAQSMMKEMEERKAL